MLDNDCIISRVYIIIQLNNDSVSFFVRAHVRALAAPLLEPKAIQCKSDPTRPFCIAARVVIERRALITNHYSSSLKKEEEVDGSTDASTT